MGNVSQPSPVGVTPQAATIADPVPPLKRRLRARLAGNKRRGRRPASLRQLAVLAGFPVGQLSLVLSGRKRWRDLEAILRAASRGAPPARLRWLAERHRLRVARDRARRHPEQVVGGA